jgi:hypothetical protein
MRVCVAARQVDTHAVVIATATGATERAWLSEFGVAHICDAVDEVSDSVLRAVRGAL